MFNLHWLRVFDDQKEESVIFYPVPANTEIKCNIGITNVRLFNATGTLVKALNANSSVNFIPVSDLPDGVYIISYTTKTGINKVAKVLIKH